VSRFAIDADMKQALKKSKWNIDTYKTAVATYRNAQNKEQKRETEELIRNIKADFKSEISKNDPKLLRKHRLEGDLFNLMYQTSVFGETEKEKKEKTKQAELLQKEIEKLEAEIEEIKSNRIFENAFEWRFEFPEVLNDDGDFVGFDAVIGNPPYIQLQAMKETSEQLKRFGYQTYEKTGDIYSLFYEKGHQILRENGFLAFITSNKWMRAGYGKTTRNFFLAHTQPELLIDLGSGVFEEATVDSNILIFKKQAYHHPFDALDISKEKKISNFQLYQHKTLRINPQKDESWTIASPLEQSIKAKIERIGKPLKEWDIQINYGIKTGYNEAFIIDGKKRAELIAQDPKSAEIIKPILRGRDIKRYKAEWQDLWLIYVPWHFPLHKNPEIKGASKEAEKEFAKQFPAIYQHLLTHKEQLSARNKAETGIRYEWYALQRWAADYYQEFEKEKIIFQEMVQYSSFIYDSNKNFFCLDTGRIITGKNLKFLIAILNSKLFFFAVKYFYGGGGLGETGVRMKHSFFENFVLKELSESAQQPFVALVEQIFAQKERGEDTQAEETQIDRMVYELYGLTEEEIKIIENS
jgi:hypothetical protein